MFQYIGLGTPFLPLHLQPMEAYDIGFRVTRKAVIDSTVKYCRLSFQGIEAAVCVTAWILWQLSTERVLCMEWVEGVKISDRKGMVQLGIRPREAATQLLKAFGEMIYIHGFVHAGT